MAQERDRESRTEPADKCCLHTFTPTLFLVPLQQF